MNLTINDLEQLAFFIPFLSVLGIGAGLLVWGMFGFFDKY